MIWNEINNEKELQDFTSICSDFHDCCLKELRYISGAYVDSDLSMYPINDQRKLYIFFQRQNKDFTNIEIEFSGLEKLSLCPNDEAYTCEILEASMFFENGKIYWGDSIWFKEQRDLYDGTWLCAKKVRWRIVDEYIGDKEIY